MIFRSSKITHNQSIKMSNTVWHAWNSVKNYEHVCKSSESNLTVHKLQKFAKPNEQRIKQRNWLWEVGGSGEACANNSQTCLPPVKQKEVNHMTIQHSVNEVTHSSAQHQSQGGCPPMQLWVSAQQNYDDLRFSKAFRKPKTYIIWHNSLQLCKIIDGE